MTPEILQLRDDLEALAGELLAVELKVTDAGACYVVLASDSGLGTGVPYAALTVSTFALWMRNEIGDRWRGNGPGMLLHDSQCMIANDRDFEIARCELLGCFAHELAHIVLQPGFYCRKVPDADLTEGRRVFHSVKTAQHTVSGFTDRQTQIFSHSDQFIRIALHICHRMEQRGFRVALPRLNVWAPANLTSPWWYRDLIQDECERLAEAPLTVIGKSDVPKDFKDLWNSDVASFFNSNPELIPQS